MSAAEIPPDAKTTPVGGNDFWSRLIAFGRCALRPIIAVPIFSIIYLWITISMLHTMVNDPVQAPRFIREDAQQYYEIGQDFAAGDFSMQYVKRKPHRQPLFPLLLAPVIKLGGGLFALGMVNVILGLLTLWALYYIVLRLFENTLVAAALAWSYVASWFLMRQIANQLMTEPLFILLELPVLYFFLQYLKDKQPRWLFMASALAGISYLARTNGLFVWLSLLGTLVCWDFWCLLRDRTSPLLARLGRFVGIYALAGLIGLICMAPSWVPRVRDYGNPIFHGHLANFMWADTYEDARSHGDKQFYTAHTYLATHTGRDMVQRWSMGFRDICYAVPYRLSHNLQWAAMVGLAVALVARNARFSLLAFFCWVQLQPLIWTSMANPSRRIAYPGVLCFEWIFAALALAWVAELILRKVPALKSPTAQVVIAS